MAEQERDNTNTFEVEEVLSKRTKNNRVEYLLKWKDFDHDQNIWVAEHNISCWKLVEKFESNQQRKNCDRNNNSKINKGT